MNPEKFFFASNIGEVSLVIAVGGHMAISLYRFGIISHQRLSFPNFIKTLLILLTVALGLFRISIEIIPCDDPRQQIFQAARFMFYGYLGFMDTILSAVSLKIIYEIKKNIIIGCTTRDKNVEGSNLNVSENKPSKNEQEKHDKNAKLNPSNTKGLQLIKFVSWLIGGEIIGALSGFACTFSLSGRTGKAATDLSIYFCGFFAIMYSKYLMQIVALKPNGKHLDRTIDKISRKNLDIHSSKLELEKQS